MTAGGNLNGVSIAPAWSSQNREALSSASIANWLWRQGGGDAPSGPAAVPVAWGINFGTYVRPPFDNGSSAVNAYVPHLVGFTGFGTLGGGNVAISVGGDAGTLQAQADTAESARRSQGLTVAVGGSGRMTADGRLVLTGGGDIDFRVGGGYNADLEARGYNDIDKKSRAMNRHALDGVLANLRGNVQLSAASLGGIALSYGATSLSRDPLDSRAPDPVFVDGLGHRRTGAGAGRRHRQPEYARRSGAGRGGGSRPRGAVVDPALSRYDGPAGAGRRHLMVHALDRPQRH